MFTLGSKTLTITKDDLTKEETRLLNSFVSLGASENLALWAIEYQERPKQCDSDFTEMRMKIK